MSLPSDIKKLTFLASTLIFLGVTSSVFAASYYVDSNAGVDPLINATLSGNTTWTTSGKVGNAISLNGNPSSYVDLGSATSLQFKPAQFTVSMWTYLIATTSPTAMFMPSYSDGWSSGYALYANTNGNFYFRYGNGATPVGSFYTTDDLRGAWHFVTATFDGVTTKLYVDGVMKAASTTPSIAYKTIASNAHIGASNGFTSFNGTIDEFRFYNRPLTSTEVSSLFNATSIPISGLVAYMPFREGTGTMTTDGSGNTGLSTATPWKSIQQVNNHVFNPGDSILFKKGGIWRDQLVIPSSGSATGTITYGSYGVGNQPQFNASKVLSGFVPYSGNIWVASSSPITQVFVDNAYYDIAHYPNVGYSTITQAPTDNLHLIDKNLPLSKAQVVGSDVYVRDVSWYVSHVKAIDYDPFAYQMTFDTGTRYIAKANYDYYLTNKLWMLDQPGEWYYDPTAGKVYVWLKDGGNPNSHLVEGVTGTSAIFANNKSYFTLQDLDVRNASTSDIDLSSVSQVNLNNLTVSNSMQDGIYIHGTPTSNVVIDSNTIKNNLRTGIYMYGTPTASATISNNTITNTGNFGDKVKASIAGVYLSSSSGGITIKNNNVVNSAYHGIEYAGYNSLIKNNTVVNSCITLSDCGAIYTWGITTANNIVDGNIIDTTFDGVNTATYSTVNEGVYLDDNSNGATITNNSITNTSDGIFVHDSFNNTITNNTVYGVRRNDLSISEQSTVATGTVKGNLITGNIWATATSTTPVVFSGGEGNVNFGTYNNNIFMSTYNSLPIAQTIFASTNKYSFLDWKTYSGQDSLSQDIGTFFTSLAGKVTSYLGGNVISNSTFDSNVSNWTKWSSDGSASNTWVSDCGLVSGCMHIFTNNYGALVSSNLFSLVQGKSYEVSFSVISSGVNRVDAIVRSAYNPYTPYNTKTFTTKTTRQDISYVFVSATSSNTIRLDFETYDPAITYHIDNVSIKEVAYTPNDTTGETVFYYATSTPKSFNLGTTSYVDAYNNKVSGLLTLQPYTSKVLFAVYGNGDLTCNNRETYYTAPKECTTPDMEGPFASLDAPYKTGIDKPVVGSSTRMYGNSTFRYLIPMAGNSASIGIVPVQASTTDYIDLAISLWNTVTDTTKAWTETFSNPLVGAVTNTIGDLKANSQYVLAIDNATSTVPQVVTSSQCSGYICTSNAAGSLTFVYEGGYPMHTFTLTDTSTSTVKVPTPNPVTVKKVVTQILNTTSIATSTLIHDVVNVVSKATSTPITTLVNQAVQATSTKQYLTTAIYGQQKGYYVSLLQTFLVSKGFLTRTQVTGVYDQSTVLGVKNFQCMYRIVCSGTTYTTEWGYIGEKTLQVINTMIGQ